MATKCVAAALQGHRRRLKKRSSSAKISKHQPNRLAALKLARLQQQRTKKSTSSSSSSSSSSASFSASPSSDSGCSRESSPVYQTRPQIMTPENRQMLEELFGRYNDKERHAADVLSSLCKAGLVRKIDSSSSLSSSFSASESKEVVALPTMRQTTHMLSSWQSVVAGSTPPTIKLDADADDCDSGSPMIPDLSFSSSSSARSSVSGGSPSPNSTDDSLGSPLLQYARLSTPSGPPPPPYDAWRKSIALCDVSPTLGPRRQSSPAFSSSHYSSSASRYASTHQQQQQQQQANPFAKFEESYFKTPSASSSQNAQTARTAGDNNGMPSPPQSPTDGSWSSKQSAAPAPTPASTLPTPPQSFTPSMQSQTQAQQYQPHAHAHAHHARHNQYVLPAPLPSMRRNTHAHLAEDIATTVLTVPAHSLARDPVAPISPLSLPHAFGRRSTLPPLHYQNYQQQQQQQPVHPQHTQHHLSPHMAAKMSARKDRVSPFSAYPGAASASASTSIASPARKPSSVPKPHCNVKYETAELDFIMYERTTKNRPWEDVTASFNAALPHLRKYADMDYLRIGGPGASSPASAAGSSPSSADMSSKSTMDRYRARPERTTPGLQASYYRLRLALPLLDEAGKLVFDAATNKQVFTEVMVRDDKSRKKNRRLSTVPSAAAASAAAAVAASPASTLATHPKPGEDSSVHLVLYFPERVTYYDYWFVSQEDKALARQRAYERNMQRAQRGLPAWHPGCDDPESGILIRNKD